MMISMTSAAALDSAIPWPTNSTFTNLLVVLAAAQLVLAAGFLVLFLTRSRIPDPLGVRATVFVLMASGASTCTILLLLLGGSPMRGMVSGVELLAGLLSLAGATAFTALVPRLLQRPSAKLLEEQIQESRSALRELERVRKRLQEDVMLRTSELSETVQRFETTLRKTPVFISNQDRNLHYTWVRNPPPQLETTEILGRSDEDVFPPGTAATIIDAKRSVMESGTPGRMELMLEKDGDVRWFELGIEPLLDPHGDIIGVTTVALDVTHRKRSEAHLRALLREVTHRAKNMLAVVAAISRQTATTTSSKAAFVERLNARIQSLSRAHDLLVRNEWQGVDLRELLIAELGDGDQLTSSRILLEGPKLMIGPAATQNLGLAIHELWHNAKTFGSLSTEEGRVRISWRAEGDGTERRIFLRWEEEGGPAIKSNDYNGFGRLFIESALGRTLDGSSKLEFRETGLVCEIMISGRHVLDDGRGVERLQRP